MGRLERIASTIAAILAREGLDYPQSKAVFKAARQKAGLTPPPDRRGSIDRLTLEEELRFIDQAYAKPNLNSEAGLSAGKSLILALRGAASSRL